MNETPSDKIHIRELRARCVVGLNPWEQTKAQEILISLTLHVDLKQAGASDQIADTVDYKQLKYAILERVEHTKYQLIERVAEEVAELALADDRVAGVDVLIDKQAALRYARSVAVEICRRR